MKSESELEQLDQDAAEERAAAQTSLAKALLDAERSFNAGGEKPVNGAGQ